MLYQSANQPFSPSTSQPISPSTSQPLYQSTNQPPSPSSTSQPTNPPVKLSDSPGVEDDALPVSQPTLQSSCQTHLVQRTMLYQSANHPPVKLSDLPGAEDDALPVSQPPSSQAVRPTWCGGRCSTSQPTTLQSSCQTHLVRRTMLRWTNTGLYRAATMQKLSTRPPMMRNAPWKPNSWNSHSSSGGKMKVPAPTPAEPSPVPRARRRLK